MELREPISQNFDIKQVLEIRDKLQNCIWMHSDKIKEFFPKIDPRNRYVMIANKVFRVGEKNFLDVSQIGMSQSQMKSLGLEPSKLTGVNVVVSQYTLDTVSPLKRIKINLQQTSDKSPKNMMIQLKKLREELLLKMEGAVVQKGQLLKLNLSSLGEIRNVVVDPDKFKFIHSDTMDAINKKLGIGQITKETVVDFSIMGKEYIVDEILAPDPQRSFTFGITFKKEPSPKALEAGPIRIDYIQFEKLLIKELIGKDLSKGFFTKIKIAEQKISLLADLLQVGNVHCDEGSSYDHKFNYVKAYTFHEKSTLVFDSIVDTLIMTRPEPVKTNLMTFRVDQCEPIKSDFPRSDKTVIVIEEVERKLRELKKNYVTGEILRIKTSTCDLTLKVKSAQEHNRFDIPHDRPGTNLLSIEEKTMLKFEVDPKVKNLKLIDTNEMQSFSRLHFKVRLPTVTKIASISKKDLEEVVRKNLPKIIFSGEELEVNLTSQIRCIITLDSLGKDTHSVKKDYGYYGELKEGGALSFQAEGKLKVVSEEPLDRTLSLEDFLEKEGVSGVAKENLKLLESVADSHKYKIVYAKYGLKPIRGILLKGPPGTGKSSLAKGFMKYLGCSEDKMQAVSGPELLESALGGTEEQIRNLFKPSEDAFKESLINGTKAPLHAILIDECEGLFRKRKQAERNYEISFTNQFLAKMDNGKETNTNLILIGCTNNPEDIDEAALRPGRFDHKLNIDLSDFEGRKKIFAYYMKPILKSLDSKVDIETLAYETEGFSGAQIMAVCRTVTEILVSKEMESLKSHEKIEVTKEDEEKNLKAQPLLVTMKDFRQSIIQISTSENNLKNNLSYFI